MSIAFLDERACEDAALSGGKGASLARITALGFAVPPGFVVDTGALARCLPDRGGQLREMLADASDEDLAPRAAEAHRVVAALEVPADLREEIAAGYARLGADDPAVAVRSSARGEDSEAASFAGQQETYLHVRGADRVVDRVRDCWASYFSERALFYRNVKGSVEDLDIAVVVQRMVDAEVAGVLFTCDPAKGRRDRIMVEAVFGLGEALVSGQLTPDHYLLERDGTIKRRHIGVQPYALASAPDGGIRRQELSEEEGGAATLDESLLADLAAIGRTLEDELGCAQDIEWARAGGTTYVLQARPVTA